MQLYDYSADTPALVELWKRCSAAAGMRGSVSAEGSAETGAGGQGNV